VDDRTIRVEVPDHETDAVSFLRRASRDALDSGAERVELLVGADAQHLRHAAHRVGFLYEGRLRRGRTTSEGAQDLLLYAMVAGDDVDGPAGFSLVMNAALPRTRVIAHAVFRDVSDRILLLRVSYKSEWELPGGIVEPHESPRRGAEREVLEEIGLVRRLTAPLIVDWLPPYLGWDDAVEFIFDGGVLTPDEVSSMELAPGEIVSAHWVTAAEAAVHVSPLAARRLSWLDAERPATTAYFEDGRPAI
jgi:8-oxo-dGTP pyrophosphatase MutT (NUDIX family)